MLKDRAQKSSALRLCISKRWLPQLEVDIEASQRIERSKFLLTDIDVLALAPSPIGRHTRLIFDCKSGVRESAIGRAFWLNGVMTKANANHGFIVLNQKVKISHDHRISAADLSVSLLHESEFEDLAVCMGGTTKSDKSIISNIDIWDSFFSIKSKFPSLTEYLDYSKSGFWKTKNSGEQCRKTVAKLRSIKAELDPDKKEHLALFGDSICLFILSLSELVNHLYLTLLKPSSHDEFSTSLLALLYGGYDNLEAAQKIRRLAAGIEAEESLNLFPEIAKFEQLVREILQAPQQSMAASILAREISFSLLADSANVDFQIELIKENPYASKFTLMAAEYLQKANRLPIEFAEVYRNICLESSSKALSRK